MMFCAVHNRKRDVPESPVHCMAAKPGPKRPQELLRVEAHSFKLKMMPQTEVRMARSATAGEVCRAECASAGKVCRSRCATAGTCAGQGQGLLQLQATVSANGVLKDCMINLYL